VGGDISAVVPLLENLPVSQPDLKISGCYDYTE